MYYLPVLVLTILVLPCFLNIVFPSQEFRLLTKKYHVVCINLSFLTLLCVHFQDNRPLTSVVDQQIMILE